MKILFSADWHLLLGQKNVPVQFQRDRFLALTKELNKAFKDHNCDRHIIGGDILDKFSPSVTELELYFEVVALLDHPTTIYTGNHEMVGKTKSILDNLSAETSRCNPKVQVTSSERNPGVYDIIDYKELHKKKWEAPSSDICFTHVRGEIPPHVIPEVDLDLFKDYKLVITGDLHSHQCTQKSPSGIPFIYPGSPLTTSFHRKRLDDANGYLVVDTETLDWTWQSLSHLPQLIRKTVDAGEELVADDYDRVVYEVTGDLADLKQVEDSDLLDKRIHKNISTESTLNLQKDSKLSVELRMWAKEVEAMDRDKVKKLTTLFKELITEEDYE